jgi:TonB-linked SusC/RagA family outer membrane protein
MKKRYIQIIIFLSFVLCFPLARAVAQKSSKENVVTIESVVKDEKGNPIKGAIIYGNEGAVIAKTESSGMFTISIPDKTDLLIECDGYEPAVFKSGEYETLKVIPLKSALFLHGEKDAVNIAFGKVKKGDLVNAVSVINPADILKYDNIQSITEALNGRVPGLLYGSNNRGIGTPMYIVDGLPRDISTINLSEVEQITVLKDINSAILYGNGALYGVILVTTKRGQAYKKQVNVSGYYGISTPTALPKYLNSADYMQYYNEAKVNDGLAAPYTDAMIAASRNENTYRNPSVDYYSKDYLKKFKPFARVTTELSGGNDVTKYYTNIGWNQTGSLLNFGTGKNAQENIFNIRANVDLKINSWIKTSLDGVAVLNSNVGPVGSSYWTSASTLQPNLFTPLIPINIIRPTDPLLKARKNDVNGLYVLGGTASYLTNPIADGYSGGEKDSIQRTLSFNNRIDFDLSGLVQGLAFHTNVSFDFYTRYIQSVNNTYSVYQPTWKALVDSVTSLTKYGSDTRPGTQNITNPYYVRRFGFYGMLDYNRTFGDHRISASLLGFGNRYKVQGDFQGNKNVNMGMRIAYGYKNKYLLDFSSAYVSSVKLPEGNRGAFSPSLGLAIVLYSDEKSSSASMVNYLKIRGSASLMNSDQGIGGFYYYDNSYTNSGSYLWNEGAWSNSGVIAAHGSNPGLGFEKRNELNLGLEGIFFDHTLSIDANVFKSLYYDKVIRPQTIYPSYFTNYIPYVNFESNSYQGAEIGLSINRSIGHFSFVIGANALYADSKVVKKDEVYADKYQYRAGRPVDARFGLVANGFFMNQTDISDHAFQAFGQVKPGDIKYVDQNHDGIIDANDQVQIGRWQAPFSYGLNLRLTFKSFSLFAKGTGSMGSDGYLSDNYYWVDGNKKYSTFILNRWTPATASTATYPRLSSVASPNNFQSSTFWLYRDNYFTIDRVQLTYAVSEKVARGLKMKNLSLFMDGSNLFTFSKYRNFRELRVGGLEPNYRSHSLGLKIMF